MVQRFRIPLLRWGELWGAVGSGVAAVESAADAVVGSSHARPCVWVRWWVGMVVRFVCVRCLFTPVSFKRNCTGTVSRLPPVSFYRYRYFTPLVPFHALFSCLCCHVAACPPP